MFTLIARRPNVLRARRSLATDRSQRQRHVSSASRSELCATSCTRRGRRRGHQDPGVARRGPRLVGTGGTRHPQDPRSCAQGRPSSHGLSVGDGRTKTSASNAARPNYSDQSAPDQLANLFHHRDYEAIGNGKPSWVCGRDRPLGQKNNGTKTFAMLELSIVALRHSATLTILRRRVAEETRKCFKVSHADVGNCPVRYIAHGPSDDVVALHRTFRRFSALRSVWHLR